MTVPTESPLIAFDMFPGTNRLKTLIEILLSLHKAKAVLSMNWRFSLRAWSYDTLSKNSALGSVLGSLVYTPFTCSPNQVAFPCRRYR